MSTTLISFLGRSPKREGGYRDTEYRFADGSHDRAAFFGFSLQRRVQPQRLVVMGTAGSMWDHLFERDVALGEEAESERLSLMDAVKTKSVSQEQLDHLAPSLGAALGCAVSLQLIPYAREEAEQFAIVRALADAAAAASVLHLDITHGFRHLPLLALVALQYLRAVQPKLVIGAVWYGAYDEDSGEAPVHDLSGLLKIAEGAEAVTRFDTDGDYGALATLMPPDARNLLTQAAFYERTHQVGQAKGKISRAREIIRSEERASLPSLFKDALHQRLTWAEEDDLYRRQRALAYQHLERGDELRATLYGFEAFLTGYMQTSPTIFRDISNYELRQDAKLNYEKDAKNTRPTEFEDYRLLRDLRNRLAHGVSSPRGEVQSAVSSEAKLRSTLAGLFKRLLPEKP